jgi:hypothetical protein
VLLSLTGASGAGKSMALDAMVAAFDGQRVSCVEFDSVGVPPGADTAWRHGVLERWVRRAVEEQRKGRHFVLCGQVPVGELLAAPSADALDGIAACLLHCSPEVRRERLPARGEDPAALHDHLAFGEWFLRHTLDPTYRPDVIRVPGDGPMCWERWEDWKPGDARWAFEVIDTDSLSREQTAQRAVAWGRDTLAGRLRAPLTGAWWAPDEVRGAPSPADR